MDVWTDFKRYLAFEIVFHLISIFISNIFITFLYLLNPLSTAKKGGKMSVCAAAAAAGVCVECAYVYWWCAWWQRWSQWTGQQRRLLVVAVTGCSSTGVGTTTADTPALPRSHSLLQSLHCTHYTSLLLSPCIAHTTTPSFTVSALCTLHFPPLQSLPKPRTLEERGAFSKQIVRNINKI